jgi:hypothetical protein
MSPSPSLSVWPVVTPNQIVIAEYDWDLAYMGVYLRLEICNRSPYLVREAELRIDGKGPGSDRVVTSREVKVGTLFPGVYLHEEVGIGEQGGIGGVSFNSVAAHAVRLTPPAQMVSAVEYPNLTADILDVTVDEEAPDLRRYEGDGSGEPRTAEATSIRILVRNAGPRVVERVRLKVGYFETGSTATAGQVGLRRLPETEWIFDMPRRDWNPYRLSGPPDAAYAPADPLPPDQDYEFTLVHYNGGPHGWAGSRDAVSVEVCELKLRA